MQIFHNSQELNWREPFGAVRTGAEVRLRLYAEDALLVTLRVCSLEQTLYQMEKISDNLYEAVLTAPQQPCLMLYSFVVDTKQGRVFYFNNPVGLGGIGECTDSDRGRGYQITVYDKSFDTPEWFRGSIMYQIFPDRFCRADETEEIPRKREEYVLHYNVYEPLENRRHLFEDGPACNDFYGGNLRGIIAKLPYIKALGVGVIYLNPIFEAYSNHRYDTADYKKIDPMLGTEEDFSALCTEAGKMGIRIILDGVFSHTGADSIYFNKYGLYGDGGAYKDPNSPYRDWYRFDNNGGYESWWGCSNLPNVDEMQPSYLDYILRDDNSVIKKWLRLGASGWRLDVADELPDEFIKILRTEVKSVKPDAVIIGEVWEDASNKIAYDKQREYLLGSELDSVMNYPFRESVIGFIMGNLSAAELNRRLMSIMENYPAAVLYSLMNHIGTHDTMRAKSLFGGMREDCGTTKEDSGTESLATYRMRIAAFLQMTHIGVPSIYYGDEAGMQGGRDPYNRDFFAWRSADLELIEWYRWLGGIRISLAAITRGFYKTLYAEGDIYAFARYFKDGKDAFGNKGDGSFALCIVNRCFEDRRIELDLSEFKLSALLDGTQGDKHTEIIDGKAELLIKPLGCKFLYSQPEIK